jgi:predicted amidohydrolase YtcJ
MLEPELVVLNGKIWTGQPYPSPDRGTPLFAEAVAVANGRFLAVGSNGQVKTSIGRNTKVLDLEGCMSRVRQLRTHSEMILPAR